MTAEIYREFLQTLAIAWLCFGVGAVLWHWRSWATFAGLQHCSKLLLLLSPVLLSAFGYRSTEAVREAELMAAAPAARSVFDEAPRMVAEYDTITTPGGCQIEFTRTRTESAGRVQVAAGRSRRDGAPDRQSAADFGRAGAGVVGLSQWSIPAGHGSGWTQQASTQQPGGN